MGCAKCSCGCLWPSSFLLGIAVFAPLEALMLCIDYYSENFPGAQVAVKLSATYDGTLTCTQLLCYCCESWMRKWSHQRIVWRHALVPCLLGLLVVYDRCIVGETMPPPEWSLGVLVLLTAVIGALDGISIGAVYGEVGIAGPGPAQAVVAGHSCGFLLLVALRVITKLALPTTLEGTRISVCIYFAVTGMLVLLALLAYLWIIGPAAAAAASERIGSKLAKQLDTLPFGAVISCTSGLRFAPCASSRGTSLSMLLVHTGLSPKTLNSMRGALSVSPTLLDASLPTTQHSNSVKRLVIARAPGASLGVVAFAPHGSAPGSTITSTAGSDGMALTCSAARTPRKHAATKKFITFRLPEDSSEEERKEVPPDAAGHDVPPQALDQQQQSGHAGAEPQLHAPVTHGMLTPSNSIAKAGGLTEGLETAGALTASALAAAAAAACQVVKDTDVLLRLEAGTDDDPDAENHALEEVVAWATVVDAEDKGSTHGSRHGSTHGSRHGSTHGSRHGSTHGSRHGSELDGLSPFQYVHMQSFGKRLFGSMKSMHLKNFSGDVAPSRRASGSRTMTLRSSGATFSQLGALKSGKLAFEDVVELNHIAPKPIYALPGRSVVAVTCSIVRGNWAFCLGILLSYLGQSMVLPALLGFVQWQAVGSWYPLLLQISEGMGDLVGKLLPVWQPERPQSTMATIASVRMLLVPAIILGLYCSAGPGFFFPMVFILLLSACTRQAFLPWPATKPATPMMCIKWNPAGVHDSDWAACQGTVINALSFGPWVVEDTVHPYDGQDIA